MSNSEHEIRVLVEGRRGRGRRGEAHILVPVFERRHIVVFEVARARLACALLGPLDFNFLEVGDNSLMLIVELHQVLLVPRPREVPLAPKLSHLVPVGHLFSNLLIQK